MKFLLKTRSRYSIDCISIRNVIIYFILFPLPLMERLFPELDIVINILRILILIILVAKLINKNGIQLTKYELCILVFLIYTFVIEVTSYDGKIYDYFRDFGFSILGAYVIGRTVVEENHKVFYKYVTIVYKFGIILNCVLMIMFPNGVIMSRIGAVIERSNWLFGSKNNLSVFSILILFFCGLNSYYYGLSSLDYFFYIIMFVSFTSSGSNGVELFSGSSTVMVIMIVYIGVLSLRRYIIKWIDNRFISIKSIAVISLIISFFIIGVVISQAHVLDLLLKFLKKDITFSGRLYTWQAVVEKIKTNFIFGIGGKQVYFQLTLNGRFANTNPYNFWLNIIMKYGIVGICGSLCIFFQCDSPKIVLKNSYIFITAFALLMVLGLSNTTEWKLVIFIMTLFVFEQRKSADRITIDDGIG